MKQILPPILLATALAALLSTASAKDEKIDIGQCPAPVQAVIRHYSGQGTFESVSLDEKKKTGGPAVYEARFKLRDGKQIEVHISPEGKVVKFEEKKQAS